MTLQEKIDEKINQISCLAELLPAVCVINDVRDAAPVWMNKRGLKQLNLTLKELQTMGAPTYFSRYFNEEDAKIYNPKILELIKQKNLEDVVSCFQQVRINNQSNWTWHFTTSKILLSDDDNNPLLVITLSMPVDHNHFMAQKAEKLLEENNFLRHHYHKFSKLTEREVAVLKDLAGGLSSTASGEKLFISSQTIDTHRKNIKKKLNTNSFFELSQYARAFDLI